MNNLFSLAGKNILITGLVQGIDLLLAAGLGKHGAQVIINDTTAECAELIVEKLHQEDIQAVTAPFSVTHKYEIDAAVEHVEKDIGPIDVLANDTGIQCRHPFTESLEQEWNDVITVNQTTVFLASQTVTHRVVERKAGKIINICSIQNELGCDIVIPYVASKGAVKIFACGICVELVRHSIQVNDVTLGYFKTEMTKALVENEIFIAWLCGRTPAACWGDPQGLTGVAMSPSLKASDFVDGHLLFVDGGVLTVV